MEVASHVPPTGPGVQMPPVLTSYVGDPSLPPQTTICDPVHTAVFPVLAEGALDVEVASHVPPLGPGVQMPPVSSKPPPQTTICEPVQTAVCWARAEGAPVMEVASHVPPTGPGVQMAPVLAGPHTTICDPVHMAV